MKKTTLISVTVIVLSLFACQASLNASTFYPNDYRKLTEYGDSLSLKLSELKETSAEEFCSSRAASELYSERHVSLPPDFFANEPRDAGKKVSATMSEIRNHIRLKFFPAYSKNLDPYFRCAKKIGGLLKTLRYIDEFISVWAYEVRSIRIEEVVPYPNMGILDRTVPNNLNVPDEDFILWRSIETGDIILAKTFLPISSYASKGTEDEFDMSHAFVTLANKESPMKHKILETDISFGLSQYSVYEAVHSAVRLQIYRAPLPMERRAELISEFLKGIDGRKVPYDFQMDDLGKNHTEKLFCSEIIALVFQKSLTFPLTRSNFRSRQSDLVVDTTIPHENIFQPGVIEVDPRLKLISEWRYLPKVLDSYLYDAVSMALFDWEKSYQYRFTKSSFVHFYLKTLWYLRKVPFFSQVLVRLFPEHIPQSVLLTYGSVQYLLNAVVPVLRAESQKHFEKHGVHLDMRSLFLKLEEIRKADAIKHREGTKTLFHHTFRS